MTVPERLYRWNSWYDQLPQEWRFQVILWPIVAVGFLNMLLTLAIRFPFALLVLIAMLCIAAIRAPYALGWIAPAEADRSDEAGARRFEVPGADWLVDLNQRYDALPDARRFWVFPAILLIAGAINMALTIGIGFSFGLLFLLALLALIAIRAPYAAGWLKSSPSVDTQALGEQDSPRIAHDPSPMIPAGTRSVEPAILSAPAPPAAQREREKADLDEPAVPSEDVKAASSAKDHDGMAVVPPSPPPAAHRELETADLGEPIVPSGDVKAAPPAEDHDSMAVATPSPSPAARRELETADLGEPIMQSDDVKAAPPADIHDGILVDPPPENETPPAPSPRPDDRYAADDQPVPPRSSSRRANRTQ